VHVSGAADEARAAECVVGQLVSANCFAVLASPTTIGRGFLPEEDRDTGARPWR
jgi:hypothetical protein